MNNSTELITGALTGTGHVTALVFAREGPRFVVSGSLTMNMLGKGRIDSVGEGEAGLNLVGEDGSTSNPATSRAWVLHNSRG